MKVIVIKISIAFFFKINTNRLFSKFNKKAFAVFFLALLFGLWSGGLFERYIFNFAFVQNFSVNELNRLNGKTVRDICYERQTKKKRIGKIIGYSRNNFTLTSVRVAWDNDETGIYTDYPKTCFSKCLEVAE